MSLEGGEILQTKESLLSNADTLLASMAVNRGASLQDLPNGPLEACSHLHIV